MFSAGSVFWSWGLSDAHDSEPYGANIANTDLQQFVVNLFADMGIQPGVADAVLASQGLVRATASTDTIAATAVMADLPDTVAALDTITISGTATDDDGNPLTDDGVVAVVEVSLDGGHTWHVATGGRELDLHLDADGRGHLHHPRPRHRRQPQPAPVTRGVGQLWS